jgi:hypothetical protein
MSKARTYINIASFKLNRISLLNQSTFNPFLNDAVNKHNIFQNENIEKINPLTKKNKIIKKHNILKKIDFNVNTIKTNLLKKNNNTANDLSLINNKNFSPRNFFKNKKINLPILIYNKNNKLLQNSKNNKKNNTNRINLQKNMHMKNSTSFSFNSLNQRNNKNDANNSLKILKPSFTDKEIQTSDDLRSIFNENKENKSIRYKINIKRNSNEKNEEDSSDDFDYKKEIEKILKNKPNMKNIPGIKNIFYNTKKIKINKYNNYVLLKSLYKIKNFKNDKFYKTEQNMKTSPIKNKIVEASLFNKININQKKRNISQRQEQRLVNFKKYQRKVIPKSYIYNLLNLSYESKIQNAKSIGGN